MCYEFEAINFNIFYEHIMLIVNNLQYLQAEGEHFIPIIGLVNIVVFSQTLCVHKKIILIPLNSDCNCQIIEHLPTPFKSIY